MRKAKKWSHLAPRTSTQPITLDEYRAGLRRDLIVNHDRLTPEFQAWGWRQVDKRDRKDS